MKTFGENIHKVLIDFSTGLPILIAFGLFVVAAGLHHTNYIINLLLVPAALLLSALIRMFVDYIKEHTIKFKQ